MFGLTSIGLVHTAISLAALAAGFAALGRHGAIASRDRAGAWYVWLTVATCLTGFFIFQHGGFGKPHALGVLVLLVLCAAWAFETGKLGQRPRLATGLYSFTFFLSWIPGVTETATRLPLGAPWASSPDDPKLQPIVGTLFALFVVGTWLQLRRPRSLAAT